MMFFVVVKDDDDFSLFPVSLDTHTLPFFCCCFILILKCTTTTYFITVLFQIRMQSQHHSLVDATAKQHRKYSNVFQTAMTIVREEGLGALYKGVVPTMLRQGCNQACNFTAYNFAKKKALEWQQLAELPSYQSLLIGGISGGLGPICNNPLDVVKTRLQKQVVVDGKIPKYTGLMQACMVISKEEGVWALWKGITPRLLRIMPGQAITFMTYEFVSYYLYQWKVL